MNNTTEKDTEMLNQNSTNFHAEYMDVTQHWSDKSAKYAGADCLLTMLYKGWQMKKKVRREELWFAGMRSIYVYYVELERDGEAMTMPVVHNPYMSRMIARSDIVVENA